MKAEKEDSRHRLVNSLKSNSRASVSVCRIVRCNTRLHGLAILDDDADVIARGYAP